MNNKEINTKNEAIETEERPYTLRRLKDDDLWAVLNIISVVFPDDLASSFLDLASGQKNIREVGAVVIVRLIKEVLKNMNKVRDDVYALLADVSGISADEIKDMEFGTTPMMIWDIVRNEKNASFFKVVSKLS